jgi:ribosomal protein S18 acetylase RimI-like enzyme
MSLDANTTTLLPSPTSGRGLAILEALDEPDLAEVACCMTDFLAWMRERYAEQLWIIDKYFDRRSWDEELAALGRRYAPPAGAVLLARVDGRRAGCVMFHDLGNRICEMKRLFIHPDFQGQRLGRKLTLSLILTARKRGYEKMRLDTGPLQPEAMKLYEGVGFVRIAPYHDYPEDLRAAMIFMERGL